MIPVFNIGSVFACVGFILEAADYSHILFSNAQTPDELIPVRMYKKIRAHVIAHPKFNPFLNPIPYDLFNENKTEEFYERCVSGLLADCLHRSCPSFPCCNTFV